MFTQRRYGERIAKRYYGDPVCTIGVHAAAYAHVVNLSEELGIDVAFPQTVARTFECAIAEGHSLHELPAMFEPLLNKSA